MNFMIEPSEQWTQRATSTDVSIVMRQSLRTAARVGIVPDSPKMFDVANKQRKLGAAIRVNLQLTLAAPDVSEEIRVFENQNSRFVLSAAMMASVREAWRSVTAAAASVWRRVALGPSGHLSA
jgi:hypothetical protein